MDSPVWGLLGFACVPGAAGGPSRDLPQVGALRRGGRLARQAGAVHDVGVQHLQQQVVQRHHVLHLHAVEVVHAFVAAQLRRKANGYYSVGR